MTVACRELGIRDCSFRVTAEAEQELLRVAVDHVQRVHKMEVTPELEAKVRGSIRYQGDSGGMIIGGFF